MRQFGILLLLLLSTQLSFSQTSLGGFTNYNARLARGMTGRLMNYEISYTVLFKCGEREHFKADLSQPIMYSYMQIS
ncbi:MAG: hypothetical protein AAF738_03195, partial [Bacteroidota bacterium]